MLKILFLGDITGKLGRKAVKKILPELKKELKPDLVIANVENIAHGTGVTESTLKEILDAGVDWCTNGDHAFDQPKQSEIYNKLPLLKPANFPPDTPGRGYAIIEVGKYKVLLINLVGRVFMSANYDCPFRKCDEILANLPDKSLSAIIIDIHAEATSEKVALKHYADGRASAVLGTHTHVPTADAEITVKGTAYITDVGMVGLAEGCIGIDKENIIKTFLTQIKEEHIIPETGKAILNGILITIDPETKKAVEIKQITKFSEIK
jgi:metallophosphoesterase (TIGR00282 family)